ncbi:Uncharacterised protein [Mycobacterium tuberculosis]|nr:Uncharacterised protein [Mycobacterium tuberculosis]
MNRSISTRPCQIAVTASANRCAVAARSATVGANGIVGCGEILN